MLFFEISAKENIELKKMFYTSMSCLDCFDEVRSDYKNLAYDIEYENTISNDNQSTNRLPTPHISAKDE